MKKIALISVSNKQNVIELAKELKNKNYEILATGNTSKFLSENGIESIDVQDLTGFPEIFSGRVKTLHPKILGGILMRRDDEKDKQEAEDNSINPIDVVCVNLYPFPEVVKNPDKSVQEKIENIDIGGPSLIRAAAKNYKFVSVLTDPSQYDDFIKHLKNDEISIETRKELAAKAFSQTAFYDNVIANYFEKELTSGKESFRMNYPLVKKLRYGENPHQKAFIYGDFFDYFEVLHGKELSYNNIIDLTAAAELVQELEKKSCAIIKHTNPCGAATSDSVHSAYLKALSCDPVSAFGGIAAFNQTVDLKTVEKMNEIFLEIICAPDFTGEALRLLKKKKNRRIVKILKNLNDNKLRIKDIPGGIIAQEKDNSGLSEGNIKLVTQRRYTSEELEDLKFAWIISKHTKSNTIVFAKDKKAIGVGAGQMSRLDSARIAVMKATEHGHELAGASAASDAFFPFADALTEIAANGITSVIQPGGSIRDQEVIEAADQHNISMIFTGIRNFKH